jgi:hypothetical protein
VQHRAGVHCRDTAKYFDPHAETTEGMQRMATFQEIAEYECGGASEQDRLGAGLSIDICLGHRWVT